MPKIKQSELNKCSLSLDYLKIPVDDVPIVTVLHSRKDLPKFRPSCIFWHTTVLRYVVWKKKQIDNYLQNYLHKLENPEF